MRTLHFVIPVLIFCITCSKPLDKEKVKNEIYKTEKDFEKMAFEKGIAEAFGFYADSNAVILRQNDTLISGKDNIKMYYQSRDLGNATVKWTPGFIEVSDCGNLGYTYGKYNWVIISDNGDTVNYKGTFHTVWKRQTDKSWKYVWD